MLIRFLSIIITVVALSACSTTSQKMGKAGASTDETNMVASKYSVASEKLEPFTPIKGSPVGAKASDRVFFGYDSSALSSTARSTLDRQAAWLKTNSGVNITVEGHCDERGTREYNLALGDRRANSVKKYLVNSGISEGRITVISYGKERPAVLGSNEAAWAENRRSVTTLNN